MEQLQLQAVEMVRAIRDEMNAETKGLTRVELKAYLAGKAATFRSRVPATQPAPPPTQANTQ